MNKWTSALFCLVICLTPSLAMSQRLDQFGGLKSKPCTATGWFHTQKLQDRWWFCTPEGHVWWMIAMYNVTPDSHKTDLGTTYDAVVRAKYGNSNTIWGPETVRRLKSWGFNSVAEFSVKWVLPITTCGWPPSCPGGWEKAGGKQPYPVPMVVMVQPSMYSLYNSGGYAAGAVKDVQSGVNVAYYGKGHNSTFPDIWDPNFYAWLDGALRNDASLKPAQNSPWVVGWVSDECDALFGLCGAGPEMATNPPGHNQRHQALMTLVSSPVQNANPGRAMVRTPQVYANQEVATKTQLKAFLQKRYPSLAALNSAWGSNYAQWDSTGMQTIAEPLGVGDGSTATFTKTLSNRNISPLSVAMKVSGIKVGGDCPRWLCTAAATGHGGFTGLRAGAEVTVSAGDIDYAKGVLTITFNRAPVSGAAITIDYVRDGWGYGAGLMDEDGRHAWIPTDKVHLGSNVAFNNDMNAFLRELATQYFSVTRERIKHYSPHSLYFGPGVLGTWGGVGNSNVLQAAATYVDVLTWQPDYRRLQSELNYVATHAGDKPIILWHGAKSTADSAMWRYANAADTHCNPCNTQEERGRFYADSMNVFVNTRNTVYDTRTIIGIRWWEFHDNWVEGNWGVVSLHDNAYDGVEACQGSHRTSLGVVTYAEESIPGWQPNHAYSVPDSTPRGGSRIQVDVAGTRYTYEVVRPGVSGDSQPPWPPREGAFAGDGSVVWKNVGVKTSQFCYGDFLTPVKQANTQWMQP